MVFSSLKGYTEAYAAEAFLPTRWLFSNYIDAWNKVDFFRVFCQHDLHRALTVAGVLNHFNAGGVRVCRAWNFQAADTLFIILLATMMIPVRSHADPEFYSRSAI